jgi:hypothetical protein
MDLLNLDFSRFHISPDGLYSLKATDRTNKYELHKENVRKANKVAYHANDELRIKKQTLQTAMRIHRGVCNPKPETLLRYLPMFLKYSVEIKAMIERYEARLVASAAKRTLCDGTECSPLPYDA